MSDQSRPVSQLVREPPRSSHPTVKFLTAAMIGKHPPGADKLDYARGQIARKAHDMKERAKEYGQYVQQKAQEATQTQAS
ncbi:hypothetical protein GH714_030816 [Hevea brasiliensis]|uniref:Uncharacterized protein n=1 Tax=Hevea brasiliensis TaxID=3981 RepID=A0A6A6LSH6_HEVBR|nr:hypothetical protein GH714_030816 [Hevea brasiliensis]